MDQQRHAIVQVLRGSQAARAGIRRGDLLCTLQDQPVADCVDYTFLSSQEPVTAEFLRGDQLREVTLPGGGNLGLVFDNDLMDNPRHCRNRCCFCFVDQQPKGLREGLYCKDDDWRLSLLTGTYVTLTNLSDAEWARIERQRPSPLYVSVHTTVPELRVAMMGNPHAGDILAQLRRLIAANITVHAQLVICPGVNDGPALHRTLQELSSLWPGIASVAVVPLGLTTHREGLAPLPPMTATVADEVLGVVTALQNAMRQAHGEGFVYAADELYVAAGRPLPQAVDYDGASQYEDGIGLTALLQEEFGQALPGIRPKKLTQTLATGTLAAPILTEFAAQVPTTTTHVIAVENAFFGPSITVAGLLTGEDIIAALSGKQLGARVLLPAVMFRDGCGPTLDNMTAKDIQKALRTKVIVVPNDGEALARALCGR